VAPELHDRHGLSPFAGRRVPRVVRTIVRGTTVFADGTFPEPPHGRLLKPTKGEHR
jgi:allantoinase